MTVNFYHFFNLDLFPLSANKEKWQTLQQILYVVIFKSINWLPWQLVSHLNCSAPPLYFLSGTLRAVWQAEARCVQNGHWDGGQRRQFRFAKFGIFLCLRNPRFHILINLWPLGSSGDILQASDDLSRVINSYKKIVEGQPINGDSEEPRSTGGNSESGERVFLCSA